MQVHFKICCQTKVVWPAPRGTNGDLFPSGPLCWQDCSWTVVGWDLVSVTDCFEIYSQTHLAGLPQGVLDYGLEGLDLGHSPLQGPKLGPRSLGLLFEAYVGVTPSRSLGIWCWWLDQAKWDYSQVLRGYGAIFRSIAGTTVGVSHLGIGLPS